MKHLKMLGLAVLAAMALTALVGAGTASAKAGVLCSNAQATGCTAPWPVGTVIDFSLKTGTSAKLTNTAGETLDTCTTATVKGKLTANPGATGTATGENTSITWGSAGTPCTWTTTTTKLGKLSVEAESTHGSGWVYADETIEVTISIPSFLGGPCLYGVAAGTTLGTISEGKSGVSTFTANAVAKRNTNNGVHPCLPGTETALWVAEYTLTEPVNTTLYVSTS